jgi:hypothetical protein
MVKTVLHEPSYIWTAAESPLSRLDALHAKERTTPVFPERSTLLDASPLDKRSLSA